MAGIYIHIPFCKQACHYCDFHFSTSFLKKDEMIDAIIKEIVLQSAYLEGQEIGTIYFGGGTPSALPVEDIHKIIDTLNKTFHIAEGVEITLESNPDDIQEASLASWKEMGINRLSIGVQAFQEELLRAWNRSHSSLQAERAIALAQDAGFENITADLIYGGSGLSDEDWIKNINILAGMGIPHISSYALTVEKGTALAHQINAGKVQAPNDEQSNRQYAILQRMLHDYGFEQYEISNFSKPGRQSRHNTSYWSGIHYLGIGPSAHSFNGVSRQWNISNNIKYISALQDGQLSFEIEMLTDDQRYNEMVMIGLRTSKGIDMERVKKLGEKFVIFLHEATEKYNHRVVASYLQKEKIFKNESGNFALRPEYYFFTDGIAAELFYDGSLHKIIN